MTSGKGAAAALHLLLVWAVMTGTVPILGFVLVAAAWVGGGTAIVLVLALGVPLMVGLLAITGLPARAVVPMCDATSGRIGWAVMVFFLGTLGVLAGLAAYSEGISLGNAEARIALTGVPYTVVAAFCVPNRWVRLGALAVLAAGVAYGGFVPRGT
ncbi:hypothetical protein ABT354_31025 [Streptomyces sp. NPDC000594]|uniref:hypothetical protein n=1 Tax=Streptomyces sp. NPDC000594 TaxID=3154261 RepID=UPI003333B6D7